MKYTCPCCGYRTCDEPVGGSMQICEVCFWEDAPGESPYNGSNKTSLAEAQRNFREFGASERTFCDLVRSATSDEARTPDWLALEDQAKVVIQLIDSAFAEVVLGAGMTIHQREVISDYGSQQEFEMARRLDTEVCWQDIPDEKIDKLGTSLVFIDPESIRYHLPAFMRFVLRIWLDTSEIAGDSVLYALADGPASRGYHADSFMLLNQAQKQSTAAFLKFISIVDSNYGEDAEKGLENGWSAYLDKFPQFSFP